MSAQDSQKSLDISVDSPKRVLAPWERAFDLVLTPLEEFTQKQTTGGLLLFVATIVALIAANTALANAYHTFFETPLRIGVGEVGLSKPIHHWINEGLMTLFFFVVGLEIKREVLVGELSEPRQMMLPMLGAIGGMVTPAMLYWAVVPAGELSRGWGITVATDIAFAVGALVLLRDRAPRNLLMLLLALAIVDDIGALIIIALFYSSGVDIAALGFAAAGFAALIALNRLGVRRASPYFLGGVVVWLALLQSGLHATLAGVITAFTIPVLPKYHPARFAERFATLMRRYKEAAADDPSPLRNSTLSASLRTMETAIIGVRSPLSRLLHQWQTPVAVGVIPVFALANAGVALDLESVRAALMNPAAHARASVRQAARHNAPRLAGRSCGSLLIAA